MPSFDMPHFPSDSFKRKCYICFGRRGMCAFQNNDYDYLHGQKGQGKAENSMLQITLMWIPKLALAAQTLSKADKDSEGKKNNFRSPFAVF